MNEISASHSIQEVVNHIVRMGVNYRSICEAFATLLFLRWADYEESQIVTRSEHKQEKLQYSHWRRWDYDTDPVEISHWFLQLSNELLSLPVPSDKSVPSNLRFISCQLRSIAPNVLKISQFKSNGLALLVEWITNLSIRTPSDFLSLRTTLDLLLYGSNEGGRYKNWTPPPVAKLMAGLAAPQAGESICDPCFGDAGALTTLLDMHVDKSLSSIQSCEPLFISGMEANSEAYIIGLTRLVLSGATNSDLSLGSSLDRHFAIPVLEGWYDIVLAVPPWGLQIKSNKVTDQFPIPSHDSSCLFIQHALSLLKPGGRAVLALPQSFLNRRGSDRELRQLIIDKHTVESVISIPRGAFEPHSSIPTCLIKIWRGGKTNSIRMGNAEATLKFISNWKFDQVQNDYEKIAIFDFTSNMQSSKVTRPFWNVDVSAIAKIDYDLSVMRRDRSSLDRILRALPTSVEVFKLSECCEIIAGKNIQNGDLIQQADALSSNLRSYCSSMTTAELLRIDHSDLINARSRGEIFGFRDGKDFKFKKDEIQRYALENGIELLPFERNSKSDLIPFVRLSDVHSTMVSRGSAFISKRVGASIKTEWRLCPGDILLSKSGSIGKVALVQNQSIGAVASGAFFVLRPIKNGIDPKYLLVYLQSESVRSWLDDQSSGSSAKHLTLRAAGELPVAIPSVQIQSRIVLETPKHGSDVVSFLTSFLSDNIGNEIVAELNTWIDSINRSILHFEEVMLGDSTEASIRALEKLSELRCPINKCARCSKPYYLDYSSQYRRETGNWMDGIEECCQDCLLGGGPESIQSNPIQSVSSLTGWALQFRHAMRLLNNISEIDDQVSVFTILRDIGTHAITAEKLLFGQTQNADQAQSVSQDLRKAIDSLTERIGIEVDIVVEVREAVEFESGELRIEASVTNHGGLPIRNICISLDPGMHLRESTELSYLAPSANVMITFYGNRQDLEDTIEDFSLNFKGVNIVGRQVSYNRLFAIKFRKYVAVSIADKASESDLGGSPYVCGTPVKPSRNDVFFGREDLIKQICRQITSSGNVVLLQGNRRAGKSSILWHLEGKNSVPGWLGVICDLQSIEGSEIGGVSTGDVFRGIAYEIVKSIRKLNGSAVLPDGSTLDPSQKLGIKRAIRMGIGETDPFGDFREYLELVLETIGAQGLGLLLMIDEFDKLQEGIDNGITSPQVPENIRFLIQTYPQFSAIITGSRRLKRMREEYFSMLFGLGTKLDVSSLSLDAASRLVTEPVRGKLNYSSEAVELCCFLSARQPYLLQCLCNRIFDLAARRCIHSITVDHVREASRALTEDNEHFATLWDYTEFDRRRFLLALICREESKPDPLRVGVIQTKLGDEGIEIPEETLISDLEFLYQLELLSFKEKSMDSPTYTLSVPMMKDWISTQPEAEFESLRMRARREVEELSESEDLGT